MDVENLLVFLSISKKPFLCSYLLPSWVLQSYGTSWEVRDAVWVPGFALLWQCLWWLKLVKDLKVCREVSGLPSKGSRDLHGESGHPKSWMGQPDINRGTGSLLCRPTKILPKNWCSGLDSIFLKVRVYSIRGLSQHERTVAYGIIIYSKIGH